jgi:hypothetical protein
MGSFSKKVFKNNLRKRMANQESLVQYLLVVIRRQEQEKNILREKVKSLEKQTFGCPIPDPEV